MTFSPKRERLLRIITIGGFVLSAFMGVAFGLAMAGTHNIMKMGDFGETKEALPSTLLDVNGKIITQFFSDEKRDLITFNQVPRHLIDALITREDQEFWNHSGFSMRGTFRAFFQILTFQLFSGGSTLTQQLAGRVYANRNEMSLKRKAVELWWAFMMEKKLTKQEILERYLNKMPFGQGTYGIEAASQFYFKHSVKDMTPAESAILAIQLVKPGKYNPFKNPNEAKKIQEEVLKQMVESGYLKKDVAQASFDEYWNNYDYTRSNSDTVFYARQDRAPYFSEYVRNELESILTGDVDIYRGGYIIQTTLNLDYQDLADALVAKGRERVEREYQNNQANAGGADSELLGVMTMLGYSFSVTDFFMGGGRKSTREARQYVTTKLTTTLDVVAKMFGVEGLQDAAFESYKREMDLSNRNQVEGALIAIENKTGAIRAMVGGTKFDRANQLNRAMQAQVQPGSSIKPLFYSAAIESGKFTAASLLVDEPTTFKNEDGTEYSPSNYGGKWRGNILLRKALNYSLNIPSLKVMEGIGFDLAIDKMSKLLGITDPAEVSRRFPRVFPLALGINTVSPAQMARAYSIMASGGREVIPVGIVEVKDRSGKIISSPLAETQELIKKKGPDAQILTPQAAYVMVDILKTTLTDGTLYYAVNQQGGMPMEMGGKTGTPQNWSDAWAIGFSPYMTTAVWYGFDKPGNSLGQSNDGATSAGPVWAEFMKKTHKSLPPISFEKPATGIVYGGVNMEDGKAPSGHPREKIRGEIFIAGTYPGEVSTLQAHTDVMMGHAIENVDTTFLGGPEKDPGNQPFDWGETPTPDATVPKPEQVDPVQE